MSFDSLIFDLDGTLWNASAASARAINQVYREFNVPERISPEFVQLISGKPADECDSILLKNIPQTLRKEALGILDGLEVEYIRKAAAVSLYPAVKEGLYALSQHYSLFLVSNCGEQYLDVFLEHSGVGELFVDSECYGRTRKAKSKNIRAVIKRNQLSTSCYIGDTVMDEAAAFDAEIPFMHAAYGFGIPNRTPLAFLSFKELTQHLLRIKTARTAA